MNFSVKNLCTQEIQQVERMLWIKRAVEVVISRSIPGMTIKDSKPALLYELLNLIFNLRKVNSVKLIK